MKWKEADGPLQGYKVRVKPISGENVPRVVKDHVCTNDYAAFKDPIAG